MDGWYSFTIIHRYEEAKLYNVTIDLRNEISNLTLEVPVDVEEKIIDFAVEMQFEVNDVLTGGLGDEENEFHNDKNITFLMLMTQGSVTRYKMYNTSTGIKELLATFDVKDKLNPSDGDFYYFFSENQELNLTFIAFNSYEESEEVEATITIQDPITEIEGVQILEGEDVTARMEEKPINITFVCASTHSLSLVFNYGDGSPEACYGDEFMCNQNFSNARFQPNDLTMPMTVQHTFWEDGEYHMNVTLFNPVSTAKSELSIFVVPFPCRKPVVTVTGASLVKENADGYFKSNPIAVITETTIPDCDVTFTIIRRWTISRIDRLTGETLEQIAIENLLPSWNKSSLLVKKNFLDFGLYKLVFSMQLYEGETPPKLPYEVMSTFFVEILRSPLVAIMVPGSVSRLVRGWDSKPPWTLAPTLSTPTFPTTRASSASGTADCSRRTSQ